jgi:hypothetical protein
MKKFFAPILLGTLLAAPAYAVDLQPWGEVDAWTVLTDPNHRDGCATETGYSDGTYFRMGFIHKGKKAYIATFSPAWAQIDHNKKFPVEIALDADTFEGTAHRVKLNGVHGAKIKFDNPEFLTDIANKNKMTISTNGTQVVSIGLKGSKAALEQTIVCQSEQE